jgi:hypothetical protein
MIRFLRGISVTPDMVYGASMLSILLSLALWFVPRGTGGGEHDRLERLAIFVGLWAPTLALLAHAIRDEQRDPA